MDELVTQGQWWWLFPVPLLTFIFAIAGSWWGSRLGRTTEHWQWLRNEKRKEYVALLDTVDRISNDLSALINNRVKEDDTQHIDASFVTPINILGPTQIKRCINLFMDQSRECVSALERTPEATVQTEARQAHKSMVKTRDDLIRLMRSDLGVKD